jgi:hypothetical protein
MLSADTSVRLTGFGGHRTIEQFLALTGVAPTSSGGVVELTATGGPGRLDLKGQVRPPSAFNVGADVARQNEHRRVRQNFGVVGALRRDEDDSVTGMTLAPKRSGICSTSCR